METKIVTDTEEVINYSLSYQAMNPHHPIQIEVIEKSDYKEFLEFCHQLAEYEYIDELSGGFARKRSNTLKFEDTLFPYTTLFRSSEERRVGKECMFKFQCIGTFSSKTTT